MFEPAIAQFAQHHRVIVPDLRGHGRSRKLPWPYTAAKLASDLSRLLDHLGRESGAVLGYSQRGTIVQQLALDHPEQCSQLVLAGTFAFNVVTFREKLELHLSLLLIRVLGMRRFAKFVVSLALKRLGKERTDWCVRLIADQDSKAMMSTLKETMMVFDSRPRLAEIRCATLIVAGGNDGAVPMHHAKMLHGASPVHRSSSLMALVTSSSSRIPRSSLGWPTNHQRASGRQHDRGSASPR